MIILPPPESEMQFGPFREEYFIHWEMSGLRKACGDGFKCVEYIYLDDCDDNCYKLIEAKKTAPNPNGSSGQERFDEYIEEIRRKFVDSTELLLSHLLAFHSDKEATLPSSFYPDERKVSRLIYIFVIKEAQIGWLRPIKDKLNKLLIRQKKLWNAEIVVFNAAIAAEYGLVKS